MSYDTTSYQACHHAGTISVCTRKDIVLLGGGISRAVSSVGVDFVLDLTGNYIPLNWNLPEGWHAKNILVPPRVLKMPIIDMHAPWEVDLSFWRELWTDFQEEARKKKLLVKGRLKVLVLCAGGHGRTGTVLAALLRASRFRTGDGDLVGYIRSHYCERAVETMEQVAYLRSLGIYVPDTKPRQNDYHQAAVVANNDKRGGDGYIVNGEYKQVPAVQPYQGSNKPPTDPGGMRGHDGAWYTSSDLNSMSDEKYQALFVRNKEKLEVQPWLSRSQA